MPVVPDPRTGKPEYFCDACGQMAHWGMDGHWFCKEHKGPKVLHGRSPDAGKAGTNASSRETKPARPSPAPIIYGGGRQSGKTDSARRDGQLDLF